MKVHELITLLQKAHPDSKVEIYAHDAYGADASLLKEYEYVLFDITGTSDWGNPGAADDLTCINIGQIVGC